MKNIKKANINVTLKQLFRYWLEITRAFHKLTNQEQNILALFLYYHYQYKKEITNDRILWKTVFDYDTKMKIKEELQISDAVIQNTLSRFRKKGVLADDKIMKFYIPEVSDDAEEFKVLFNFNIV